jgi:hypothetical protein
MAVVTEKRDRWAIDGDVAFALLLENSAVRAVLGNLRPDGNTSLYTSLTHPSDLVLTRTTAGVAVFTTVGDSIDMTLGGGVYGQQLDLSYCVTECVRNVTSTFTPGAGSYQLLFGMYNMNGEIDYDRRSALLVKSVTVPESSGVVVYVPEPPILLGLSIGVIGLWGIRRACFNSSRP